MNFRLHLITFAATAAVALTASSCSCDSQNESDTSAPKAERIISPDDSAVYYLGRGEGLELLDCETQNEICDRLLDLRAREHIIRTQMGQSSADAYIYGIEDAVRESGDTLINVIASDMAR